jgi:hypothetical protein
MEKLFNDFVIDKEIARQPHHAEKVLRVEWPPISLISRLSALPPKANMCGATRDVSEVPIDILPRIYGDRSAILPLG